MKSENGSSSAVSQYSRWSSAVSQYSRWLWPPIAASLCTGHCHPPNLHQAILKRRKLSWQLKPTLAMNGTWWQLEPGKVLGAVHGGSQWRGVQRPPQRIDGLEEELAATEVSNSVCRVFSCKPLYLWLSLCRFADACKVFDGIPCRWMESTWMLGLVNMLLICFFSLIGFDNLSLVCS